MNFNEKKPTRAGYGEGLLELGEKNPNVVGLGADLTESTSMHKFKEKFPDRYFSVGIAEQDMACVAAGFAISGKIPYMSTFGIFASGRCWEQIRSTICYSELNVKIGGSHGGISVGPDGATHQALEEVALMRCIPTMKVIVPCDALETKKATIAVADIPGPAYLRFGREAVPTITSDSTPFEVGKAITLKEGTDLTVIACGVLVYEALMAAEALEKEGISCKVINMHTIKPLDEKAVLEAASQTGAIITAEEHQSMGGLGSAVAEVLSTQYPVPLEMVAVFNRFGESGPPSELMVEFGLTSTNIINSAHKILKRKK